MQNKIESQHTFSRYVREERNDATLIIEKAYMNPMWKLG